MAINANANEIKVDDVKVVKVKKFDNGGIVCDIEVRGVTIYNMSYWEKDGKTWFNFPQQKGKDGKYYSHCYFKISNEVKDHMEKECEKLLK